jgi:hypothetical protein
LLLVIPCFGYTQNVKTYIPPRAFIYKATVEKEVKTYFPQLTEINYVPALIEHESCISLKHSRCWSPTSELRSKRERGLGLGMVTQAYREDGSLRFDTLSNLKAMYKTDLREASWDTLKERPDLQMRMIILLLKDDYSKLYNVTDPASRLHMTDNAYNGGVRDVQRARRSCGLASGCNPGIWFDNTERFSPKSLKVLYGSRSAKDISLHHTRDVFFTRLPKYKQNYIN